MDNLPLWFLILSLFLPRISLIIAYFHHDLAVFRLSGWIPPTLAVIIPRLLVSILIFQDRGFGGWLLVHAIAIALTYLSAGSSSKK
jgi:hypothetical protein